MSFKNFFDTVLGNPPKQKKQNNVGNIKDKIVSITEGPLGMRTKHDVMDLWNRYEYDDIYEYNDGKLWLYYRCDGISAESTIYHYYATYNGIEVFPDNVNNDPSWINYLNDIYNQSESLKKAKEKQLIETNEKIEMWHKISESFGYLYPEGYQDDKICIYDITPKTHTDVSYTAGGSRDTVEYRGIVSLPDGTIVFDSKNQIFRKGMWLSYFFNIANAVGKEKARQRELEIFEKNRQKEISQVLQRTKSQEAYDKNHMPIDDSRFFK